MHLECAMLEECNCSRESAFKFHSRHRYASTQRAQNMLNERNIFAKMSCSRERVSLFEIFGNSSRINLLLAAAIQNSTSLSI